MADIKFPDSDLYWIFVVENNYQQRAINLSAEGQWKLVTLDVTDVWRYYSSMILGFQCKDTQSLFEGRRVKRWANIETVAIRKLAMLNRAAVLTDLKIPPQNCLEALKRDRKGQHSIRINDQWRLCFCWTPSGPENVEIVDYH